MKKKVLHIDFTPAQHDLFYAPDIEVIGDISSSLYMLASALHSYSYNGASVAQFKTVLEQRLFSEGAADTAFPVRPRRIIADCRSVLGPEDILCLDNGIYKLWFSRHYRTYGIGTFLLDNSLATMGAGLPSAMTAKLVHPEKRVLAVCGDGGFLMNSQELETAVRLGLNVVVLILNDNGYGFIKWKQENMGYPNFGLEFGNPDLVKYAEAYGAFGYRLKSADELREALEKAFSMKCPVLIECPIDYSENVSAFG